MGDVSVSGGHRGGLHIAQGPYDFGGRVRGHGTRATGNADRVRVLWWARGVRRVAIEMRGWREA